MTFKHVKFEDSAVMRSLEKVAKEKGWSKEEPLKKTAAPKADLSPTANLTENILKLCGGLRQRGFDKYANELEDKLVVYKQAATLYEAHDEKGEDLVDAAHPQGSHHLEGVPGDEAVFETIIDQHMKSLKMIDKMPNGKLASSRDVLKAVKIALGQEMPPVPDNVDSMSEDEISVFRRWGALAQLKQIPGILAKARNIIQNKMNTTTLAHSFDTNLNEINTTINSLSPDAITVKNVDEVMGDLGDIQNSLDFFNWKDFAMLTPLAFPNLVRHVGDLTDIATGDWDQALRNQITGIVTQAKAYANTARANLRGTNDSAIKSKLNKMKEQKGAAQVQEQAKTKPVSDFESAVASANRTLSVWLAKTQSDPENSPADKAEAKKWIGGKATAIKSVKDAFDAITDEQGKIESAPSLLRNLSSVTRDFNDFASTWIG